MSEHGQALANLAGLIAEALMREGVDVCKASSASVTAANVLNANPQVMRELLDSL